MSQNSDDIFPKNLARREQDDLTPGQGTPVHRGNVEQDLIVTGDIYGGYVAIGRGAQVIVQHVLSAAEEAEQRHQIETRILAQAVASYVESFRSQLPQAETSVSQAEPYKSLLPYRLTDAPLFFGRDQATVELLNSSGRGRLTVLHAESGAGKTSLLQAGLGAHLLAQGHLPIYVRAWRHSPSLAIKQTLLPDLGRTPQLAQLPLRAFLRRVTEVLGLTTIVYLLLDQFEEFFIRIPNEATREEFIEELGQCVEDETLQVRFVLSLRKDYFANLSDFRGRLPTIFANEYPLKLFSRTEAASAITAPATLVGLTYGPDVVDHILDELQANEHKVIMPAQLQLVCWALYRGLDHEQRLITLVRLQQMEGVAGILRNYLRRVIAQEIPASQRVAAQRILEALVRSDRSSDIQTTAQLARQVDSAEMLPPVLVALVSSRLLRVVETGPEVEVAYELAHDYLIEQIELDPEVLARKAAQELLDQEVAAWQQNPLLRIGEEKLKIIQAQESKIHFSPAATELYELSKKARRRRRSILFGLIGGVILALGVASLLGISYVIAENNLGIAQSALVTATSVIQSAQDAAANAENKQATAEWAENIAQNKQATAVGEANIAQNRQATASSARQTAEAGQYAAVEAEQTALVAGYAAQTRQAEAEQGEAAALMGQATAETAQQQAIQAEQTAQAGQQMALQAQQTAQAQQGVAEQAAQQAQAAAAAAQQAQAMAEAARQKAEQAQRRAEAQAAQARREREQAEQAAQQAEATRVAVEALRDQAERELQETRRIAAIIRDTKDCPVGGNPGALTFDGLHIWVTNKLDNSVTKLRATDCANLGTFATGGGPSDVIYGGGFIWVANRFDNTVKKINIADGATLNTFTAGPPGSWPTSLLYDGAALWIASELTNKIRKIDPTSGADLGTYDTGDSPADLAYDGHFIWVANSESNTVSRIDANGSPQGTFPVGSSPVWLTYDDSHIWVANQTSDTITKLRASDGAFLGTFNTGGLPDALAFDGNDIWSANIGDHTITRLQPVDGTLLSTLPTAKTPTAMLFDGANLWVVAEDDNLVQKIPITINLVGQEPVALAYDGLYIWVANQGDNTVSKMLAASGERLASFGVGQRPVALISAGASVWVVQRGDDTISKLRAVDGANLGTFAVGAAPSALAYDGTYMWISNHEGASVTRLREADGANTDTFPVGDRPVDILYDGSYIWVALEGEQVLLKLNSNGSSATRYNLGITPRSFLYDGVYFWVGYTVDAIPEPPETRLRQIRASDGAFVSDTGTGITGSPAIAPAAVVYDGTYIWLSSPNTIGDSMVIRLEATNPNNLVNFPVCAGPSALLYANSVWVACKNDDLIQKLPNDLGLSGFSAALTGFSTGASRQYLPIIVK